MNILPKYDDDYEWLSTESKKNLMLDGGFQTRRSSLKLIASRIATLLALSCPC